MTAPGWRWTGPLAGVLITLPGVVLAECLGESCYDGLGWLIAAALLALVALLAVAVYVVVLMVRRQWHRAGVVAGATVLLVWLVGLSLS